MARPGTWTEQQLIEMYAEIQKNGQSIKDYTDLNKISYHKLYQAFRRYEIVGQYADSKLKKVSTVKEPTTV